MSRSKLIFVTGGVTSSLGKGIIASSLGNLFQSRGYKTTIIKLDPYLNVDPGTLNPYEHGECYVTADGAETDLDLGHYERFLDIPMSQLNNVTTGSIYQNVIERERKGDFLGKTVQIIPHITDEIKSRILLLETKKKFQIIIVEIGGTVGDIESLPYIEALRQLKFERKNDVCVVHLTLLPFLSSTGEIKTKPTQHSVKTMLQSGVQPDIIVCRTEVSITEQVKNKIALFCNVNYECVIEAVNASTIYEVPLLMLNQNLDHVVAGKLGFKSLKKIDNLLWSQRLKKLKNPKNKNIVAIIGKYVELKDSYKSIYESLIHASALLDQSIEIKWIHSEKLNPQNIKEKLNGCSGVIVAPGFGIRGVEGKILAVKFIREQGIPFLGICLGMQVAVIEFARNVCGLKDADSTEMNNKTNNPVIDLMKNQTQIVNKGGTMRLGGYKCYLHKDSNSYNSYKTDFINERHRHRYEFNNDYKQMFLDHGMVFAGLNKDLNLVEVIELNDHPWFVGVQFHPEYQSSFINPHPLFVSFIKSLS
ncbi:MAG: CTP synthase [Flavobacteriales bacterium TMED191]|nr:MAG: CTP synthase [Flavobacteriales bacterium TMED191]|tara:strand:+ start:1677 stop:3272 length:1596 start_codon:yes stop_codon:yes gene_type:complete